MSIWKLVGGNLRHGPKTLRFPQQPQPAAGFRGVVRMDPTRCLTCGICDHVCVSGAVHITSRDDDCLWSYDPGRCTFCGRCVDHCPGTALRHSDEEVPAYSQRRSLEHVVVVAYPRCVVCGQPAMPLPERLLLETQGLVCEELRQRSRLCDRCRRRRSQAALKTGLDGSSSEPQIDRLPAVPVSKGHADEL